MDSLSDQVAAIRSSGYEGPLTHVSENPDSDTIVLHLLAFKNLAAREGAQRQVGGFRYALPPVISRLLRFFTRTLRPLLQPTDEHPFVFVQPVGRDKGGPFNAKKDGFGALCGYERGLNLGTSVALCGTLSLRRLLGAALHCECFTS